MARFGEAVVRPGGDLASINQANANLAEGNVEQVIPIAARRFGEGSTIQQQSIALETKRQGIVNAPEFNTANRTIQNANDIVNNLVAQKSQVDLQHENYIKQLEDAPVQSKPDIASRANILNAQSHALDTAINIAKQNAESLSPLKQSVAQLLYKGDTATANSLISQAQTNTVPLSDYQKYVNAVTEGRASEIQAESSANLSRAALQKAITELNTINPTAAEQLKTGGSISLTSQEAAQLSPQASKVLQLKPISPQTTNPVKIEKDLNNVITSGSNANLNVSIGNNNRMDVGNIGSSSSINSFFNNIFGSVKDLVQGTITGHTIATEGTYVSAQELGNPLSTGILVSPTPGASTGTPIINVPSPSQRDILTGISDKVVQTNSNILNIKGISDAQLNVNIPSLTKSSAINIEAPSPIPITQIQSAPYLKAESSGAITYINPTVIGRQLERQATENEAAYYLSSIPGSQQAPKPIGEYNLYNVAKTNIAENLNIFDVGTKELAADIGLKPVDFNASEYEKYFENRGQPKRLAEVGAALGAFGIGAYNLLLNKPSQVILTTAIGAALGGTTAAAGLIASDLGVSATTIALGENIVNYGAGAYFGVKSVKSLVESKTPYEAATILGEQVPGFLGFEAGNRLGAKSSFALYDIQRTAGMTELKLAPLDLEPFTRNGQNVYMKRYEGIKLSEPSSIINYLKGYEKGQFLERQYRIVAPEVQAAYEGVLYKGKEGASFPYANPSEHLEFFTGKNIAQYGLPKTGELNLPSEKNAFGYSATGKEIATPEIGEAGQFFSGKGVSIRFLRIGNKYSYSLIPQTADTLIGRKPQVYAAYAKAIENPGYEIKVPNPYEVGGKPIKKYIFSEPTEEGVFNLPLYKREVEGIAYGQRLPIRNEFYFKIGGRRVPIEEDFIIPKGIKTDLEINTKGEPQPLQSSVLPSYAKSPISSPINIASGVYTNYESSSYLAPISSKSIISDISSASNVSSISKVSNVSNLGSYSPDSSFSNIPGLSASSIYVNSPFVPTSSGGSSTTTPTTQSVPYVPITREEEIGRDKKKYIGRLNKSYSVLIKRRGKYQPLATNLTKGKALFLGESETERTLARTFKLVETGLTAQQDIYFRPGQNFREYKIRKGQRIITPNTFIQKIGIETGSEKTALQEARRQAKVLNSYNL